MFVNRQSRGLHLILPQGASNQHPPAPLPPGQKQGHHLGQTVLVSKAYNCKHADEPPPGLGGIKKRRNFVLFQIIKSEFIIYA